MFNIVNFNFIFCLTISDQALNLWNYLVQLSHQNLKGRTEGKICSIFFYKLTSLPMASIKFVDILSFSQSLFSSTNDIFKVRKRGIKKKKNKSQHAQKEDIVQLRSSMIIFNFIYTCIIW